MGKPIPPAWPDIDDNKWYWITMDEYDNPDPPFDRCQIYLGSKSCCIKGVDLNFWIDTELDCKMFEALCFFPAGLTQRVADIVGPFDDNICTGH